MTYHLYQNDLPSDFHTNGSIAIDCETMGLVPHRDRLCLVQVSTGDGCAHLVHIKSDQSVPHSLVRVLSDPNVLKIFHYGRFDIAVLLHRFGVLTQPVYCTKIASKIVRTYTDRHGLKNLLQELLKVDISKQQQTSYWGGDEISPAQMAYAASDVLHLHNLKKELDIRLKREKRLDIAQACFHFLPHRAALDLLGWQDIDIFAH